MIAHSIKILVILLLICNLGKAHCFSQENKEQTKQETIEENKSVVKNIAFDKSTGVVSYELSVPARVRIRIGIADGLLYRTIVDWDERGIGKHRENWDGMDSPKGRVKLIGRDDLVFTFNYFTAGDEYRQNIQIADILPLSANLIGRHLPNLQVNQMHKAHPREFCHSPEMNIRLPNGTPRNKDGIVIIKGKTPIEISILEKDKIWFSAERYSLHIFIDDVFIQGELEGYTPYTWIFNPTGLNEGEHLIAVNLAGYSDHYGIATLPVYIKNKEK